VDGLCADEGDAVVKEPPGVLGPVLSEPLWRGEDDPEDVEGDEVGLVVGVFEAEPL
jgi:hypothetical protein